jgi:hypothetical protein
VDSGEKMRFSLKYVGVNVRSCDWTYSPLCHSGRMTLSPDVRLECDREALFSPAISQL